MDATAAPATGPDPANVHTGAVLSAADEAEVARRIDAQCLAHVLVAMRLSVTLAPLDVLWSLAAWHVGLRPEVAAGWLLLMLLLRVGFTLAGRRLQRWVTVDAATGLRQVDRLWLMSGLVHAALIPVFFAGTSENAKLLFTLVGNASAWSVVMAAAGRPRAYWSANLLPLIALLLGWGLQGGVLGWSMVAVLLLAQPLAGMTLHNQHLSWQRLVRLGLANERLAASLAAERDRAQAAAEARTRFFAAASHDLRQPLHALAINATTLELLARRADDPQLRTLSQGVGRALAQSQGLLDALLDISRLDAGAVKVAATDTDIGTLLRQLQAEFAGLAAQRALAFQVEIADAAPWARTDADPLMRILRNLLDNAFKFTEQGAVRLQLAREAPAVLCIRVADSGPGIAPADRERVFEEFFQVGNPTRDRSRGLGLGLAIVRRTAALIGAQVALAEPPPGGGTVFELRLPAVAPPAIALPLAPAPPTPAVPDALAVLLVDDEPGILDAMATLLRTLGWQAHAVCSIEDALALAAAPAMRIDVAVVDHRLPQGDGIGLVQRLQRLRPGLPALIVSGDAAAAGDAARHGLRVLHKPLDGATLSAAIAELARPR
ncbi:MAG: hybrid sensor histidine kinase/response regulator [Burkholderiales bacterium]|nr:hybrid sensor histidine kinase/response regulator [Burkholderiales bacterium]